MLTVVFATRNRAASLPRVLEAFAALHAPVGGWRLLIVDNGSMDATGAVVRSRASRLPVTLLHCQAPGKNRALNAALPHLEGDLAVFTDDDVLPEADWLIRLRAAVDAHPEAMLFGGTVLPDWPAPIPPWLSEEVVEFSVLYAKKERPSGPCGFGDIFGPNMAIRRSVFEAGTRFAEHVGPDAANPLYAMGSETELLRRLEAQGHRGWFEASARVRHIVRPEQIEERWILERAFRYGIGEGRNHAGALSAGRPLLTGLPAPLLSRILAYRVAAWGARLMPPSPGRLRIRYRERWLAGVAAGRRASPAATPATADTNP
ncbi:glycosyltransferase [Roseicella aerolata]|uniref:Glycosyltransferase n=1 Tax=Roseicella aerolata TaxID=2883479 RepID=A0A9X1I924_9PROT|nr:glycosyltransferase family 2 protein [Roseicella aerolata]MCB4820152.1 glycosyltransferase [Roseicella aerolata]